MSEQTESYKKVEMSEEDFRKTFISVEDRLPDHNESVLIITDCPDCPIGTASYYAWSNGGEWITTCVCQCDEHYETDQKFNFIGTMNFSDMKGYTDRITHWRETGWPKLKDLMRKPNE